MYTYDIRACRMMSKKITYTRCTRILCINFVVERADQSSTKLTEENCRGLFQFSNETINSMVLLRYSDRILCRA